MAKIVGIDVGTNSLGITIRDNDLNSDEQIIYSTVHQFKSGVGNGKTGEYSLAAQRTEKRAPRKRFRVRRYRKWATLRLLIEHNACPLTIEELEQWEKYDKAKGVRKYPADNEAFESWIRCDFNNDGLPDAECPNPYALRAWLATEPDIDFTNTINRYKFGRAIYHIAQRRGFKSSKGERVNEGDDNQETTPKESEQKQSAAIHEYMGDKLPTIGCALYEISKTERVRAHKEYRPVRKDYQDEIAYIFDYQQGLANEQELRTALLSEKKNEGTIFYKRPLKSQKGLVGKCTLEPSKPRCPQSRPEFELFTAWSFINNIRFGEGCAQELTLPQKQQLFNEKFIRATDFQFNSIRRWIELQTGTNYTYDSNPKQRTINYADNTKVEACVVTYRLRELLGDDWMEWEHVTTKSHTTGKHNAATEETHQVVYHWEDVWHVCFDADDEEPLERFAQEAALDKTLLIRLFNSMPMAYAGLSLKAIRNINCFLLKGMRYNDACLFAKLPDILGDAYSDTLIDELNDVVGKVNHNKNIVRITNALIAYYKMEDNRWAEHDTSYTLQPSDYDDIQSFAIDELGNATWNSMTTDEQTNVIESVATLYQQFFSSIERTFVKTGTIKDALASYLADRFPSVNPKRFDKLYHHSQISCYRPAREHTIVQGNAILHRKLLDSPAINAFRNPMALRVLHTLRQDINRLLADGTIYDDDTKIVVEVARELNDANMRWAIKEYNDKRRDENREFEKLLGEFIPTNEALRKVRYLAEQSEELQSFEAMLEDKRYDEYKKKIINRYRLWREQNGQCFYTGETISLSDVLNGDTVDIEHTLPRSQSFDDSMENQTLCLSSFNRQVKRNQIPSQLDNYEDILRNLQPWEERIERIKERVSHWRYRAKKAQDKDSKDYAIRQRHLWEMELQYWQHKVGNFKLKEIKRGFRNSQLNDTSTIAKYATLFLKSLFTSVEVQKGSVTAAFRNIIGVPEKRRDNNSHHAVDALVLTYIPSSAPRENLLKLYYEQQELEAQGRDASHIKAQLQREKMICGLNVDLNPKIQFIRENVIARFSGHEQVITPAKRKQRSSGRIVPLRDADGQIIFETNADGSFKLNRYGNKIPKARYIQQGDSIRGKLFEDNFYGKIMIEDQEKVVIRRNGGYIPFEEKHIPDIIDPKIREAVANLVKEKGFKQAMKDGLYIVGPTGVKTPIRHIRCEYKDKPVVPVKKHAYTSTKEHKQYAYAVNGEVVLYALYENGKAQEHRCVTLAEVANANRRRALISMEDLLPASVSKNGNELLRSFVLHRGTMLILRKDGDNLSELSMPEISKRLYRFRSLDEAKRGTITLQHHLYSDTGGGSKPAKVFEVGDATPKIIVARSKQKFWIEGIDFEMVQGKVIAIQH